MHGSAFSGQFINLARVLCCVGAIVLLCSYDWGEYSPDVLRAADTAVAQSKGMDEEAMLLKCSHAIQTSGYSADMYEIAKNGYSRYRTPEWLFLYGKACQFRYQDKHRRDALDVAERLFAVYVREAPYDPSGHVEWGWCLSHQGRPQEAEREFLKALELKPDYQAARNKLQVVQSHLYPRRLP